MLLQRVIGSPMGCWTAQAACKLPSLGSSWARLQPAARPQPFRNRLVGSPQAAAQAQDDAVLLPPPPPRLQAAQQAEKDSAATAAATLVNVAVGAGILSMPYSFSLMGWALGLFFTCKFIAAVVTCYGPVGREAVCMRGIVSHNHPADAPTPPPAALWQLAVAVAAVETATLCVLCAYAEESAATSYSGLVGPALQGT